MHGEGLLNSRRTWWRNRVAVPLAFAVALTQLVLVPFAPQAARATSHDAPIIVDTGSEASLRAAITQAIADGVDVHVPPGVYGLSGGSLTINGDVSIIGLGTRAADVEIDGLASARVFEITAGSVHLENIKVYNGKTTGRNDGGGIRVAEGSFLELFEVQVEGNTGDGGGGLYNAGTVVVERSTFLDNTARRKGGGIENDGLLTLVNSTLSANKGKGGGGLSTAGTAHVSFSTVWDNESTNKIGAGTLRNGGTLSVRNSIVANNVGSDGDFHDCSGSPDLTNVIVTSDQGCNPDGPTYVFPVVNPSDVDNLALPISNLNGGKTDTHALPDGSPAVDPGTKPHLVDFGFNLCTAADYAHTAGSPDVSNDQRGVTRDSDCDIGAYEWTQPLEITGVSLSSSHDPVEVGAAIVPIENIQAAIVAAAAAGTSTSSTPLSAIPLSAIPLSAIPLSAIPLSAIELELGIESIPLSAIPLSAIPLSAIPLSAIPLSAIPLSAIPLSAIQIDSTPLSAIPLSAILLSELSTSGGESIESYLAGTPLQGTPILALNFEDLVAVPLSAIDMDVSPLSAIPLSAIPLSAIGVDALEDIINCSAVVPQPPNTVNCSDSNLDLGDVADAEAFSGGTVGDVMGMDDINVGATPLSAIPLSAIALGDVPLSAIPLSAIAVDDLELTLQGWCDALNAVEPGLCADLDILNIDPIADPDGDYTLMALALGGIPLSAIPLSAIPLSAIPLSAIPLSAIPLSAITWASTPLSAIPLSAIPLSAIDPEASPLSAIPLSAIPLSAIDCDAIDCGDPLLTLGHAADADAILPGATLNDILLAIGGYTVGDLDGIDFGDYTFQDLLYGLLAPSEIPWEEIDIETARFPDAGDPSQPTFDYLVDFSLESPTPVDMTITLTPPDGFLFASQVLPETVPATPWHPVRLVEDPEGAATQTNLAERPTEGAGGVLTLVLPGILEGDYQLRIAMRAGVVLGTFEGSVDVEADRPSDGRSSGPHSDTDLITVVQASINEPGSSELRDFPLVVEGDLELAHIASGSDLDLYQFEVSGSLIGQSAKILLSNLPDDYDLVLYGPPLAAPLRNASEQGFDAVEAFVWDLNPEDEVLDTETLEDVPHDPEVVGLPDPETIALHAVSSRRGTNDEEIDSGTLQNGTYYVQVSSYNGAFSDDPYLLRLRLNGGVLPQCDVTGFTYDGIVPLGQPAVPDFPELPDSLNTIVLYNHERLYTDFATDASLELLTSELGLIPDWDPLWGSVAAVIPIDADLPPGVSVGQEWDVIGALETWNESQANLCDPQEANNVVREIGKLIDYVAADHDIENVVLIGDDSMIPFARIPDKTSISNERTHGVGFEEVNETVGALLAGYYLSDDPFGTTNSIEVNNLEFFVPTTAVGRLVEEPGEIAFSLSNFRTYAGVLDASTGAIATGYDFLEDGAVEVRDNLVDEGFSGLSDTIPVPDTNDPTTNQLINEEWSTSDLESLISSNGWSVLSLNAHFDQTRALPAEGNSSHNESDLYTSAHLFDGFGNPLFTNQLIFSMGCHAGLSISDIQIGTPGGVPDWAQSLGVGGNVLVGNTGFGYGDTEKVAYSEAVSAAFAGRLGSMTAGQAWVGAKQEIASGNYILDPYTMKAMQEFVFYGLPMLRTSVAAAAAAAEGGPGGGASGRTGIAPLAPFNAGQFAEITFLPPVGSGLPQIIDPLTGQSIADVEIALAYGAPGPGGLYKHTTPEGDYWAVDDNTLQVQGRPIQPRTGLDVTDPDGDGGLASYAAGVLITGLTGRQELIDPLISSPTVDIGDGDFGAGGETDFWRPEADDPTFPAGIQRVVTYVDDEGQTRQQWVVIPGRYNGNTGIQELFVEVQGEVYYRSVGNDDFLAPWIRESVGFYGEDIAFFEIIVEGEDDALAHDDVERVYVLFREEGVTDPTKWLGVDLLRSDPNSNLWVGGRPRESEGTNFEFLVQAVDKNGNVSTAAAKGDYFNIAAPIELGEIEITLTGAQDTDSVWYLGDVFANATSPGNITGYRLDGVEGAWDGGPIAPDSGLKISGNGGHFLEVFDDVGGFAFRFVAIDDTGPVVSSYVTPEAVNGFRAPGAIVTIDAADPFGSGVERIEYSSDGFASFDSAIGDTADVEINATTTLDFRAVDNVGNTGVPGSEVVQIDSTPPVVTPSTSVSLPASGWFTTDVNLVLDATDTESGSASISYSFDWDPDTQTGTWTTVAGIQAVISLTASGIADIWFYGTDNVGNEPLVTSLSPLSNFQKIKVDKEDPSASVAVENAGGETGTILQYGSADFVALISCTDPAPGSGIVPDGSCDATVSYPGGSPSQPIVNNEAVPTDALGDFEISVVATDGAGRTSPPATTSYTVIDTIPPELLPGLPTDGQQFQLGLDTPVASFSCDGGTGSPVVSCTATVNGGDPILSGTPLPVDGEGPYTFVLTGTDAGGASATLTITYHVVDTEAPTVSATAPLANEYGWYSSAVPVTIVADAGFGTPLASVEYSLDNSSWSSVPFLPDGEPLSSGYCVDNGDGSATCLVEISGEGNLTVYTRATDSATYRPPPPPPPTLPLPPAPNVGTGTPLPLNIDLTDPTITVTTPVAGQVFAIGEAATFDFGCGDALSGIDAAVGCTAVVESAAGTSEPFITGVPIDTSTPGVHTLVVTTADEAGNTHSESVSYSVAYNICYLYDTERPQPNTGTIVIKLYLCDADGNNLSSRDNVLTAVGLNENPPLPNDQGGSNDGFEFRYRANSNSFIYNLDLSTIGSDGGGFPSGSHTLFFVVDSTDVQIIGGVPVPGPNDVLYEAPFVTR